MCLQECCPHFLNYTAISTFSSWSQWLAIHKIYRLFCCFTNFTGFRCHSGCENICQKMNTTHIFCPFLSFNSFTQTFVVFYVKNRLLSYSTCNRTKTHQTANLVYWATSLEDRDPLGTLQGDVSMHAFNMNPYCLWFCYYLRLYK